MTLCPFRPLYRKSGLMNSSPKDGTEPEDGVEKTERLTNRRRTDLRDDRNLWVSFRPETQFHRKPVVSWFTSRPRALTLTQNFQNRKNSNQGKISLKSFVF